MQDEPIDVSEVNFANLRSAPIEQAIARVLKEVEEDQADAVAGFQSSV